MILFARLCAPHGLEKPWTDATSDQGPRQGMGLPLTHSTAAAISQHYNGKKSGDWYRLACPAHGGKKRSLAICDGDRGGIMAVCHSQGCAYADIMDAFRNDGALPPQTWIVSRRPAGDPHRPPRRQQKHQPNAER